MSLTARMLAACASAVLFGLQFCTVGEAASTEYYEVQLEKAIFALEQGDPETAAGRLADLEPMASHDVELLFYLGQAHWQAGDTARAAGYFRRVRELSPESDFGAVASKYLEAVDKAGVKPYFLQVFAGAQYDSNVPLKPEARLFPPVKERVDWSLVAFLKGGYARPVPGTGGLALGFTYDFYQSVHFSMEQYDVQDHDLKAYASYTKGPVVGLVAYELDYAFLGATGFERSHGVVPKLRLALSPRVTAEAYYRYSNRDFFTNDRRDSNKHGCGLNLYYYFMDGSATATAGYRYETEDASGQEWDLDGYALTGGVSVPLPWDLRVALNGEYQRIKYGRGRPFGGWRFAYRENNNTRYSFSVGRQITENLGVLVAYTNVDQDSTFREFDYGRELVSLFMTASY